MCRRNWTCDRSGTATYWECRKKSSEWITCGATPSLGGDKQEWLGSKDWVIFAEEAGVPDLAAFEECVKLPADSFARIDTGRDLGLRRKRPWDTHPLRQRSSFRWAQLRGVSGGRGEAGDRVLNPKRGESEEEGEGRCRVSHRRERQRGDESSPWRHPNRVGWQSVRRHALTGRR